MMLVQWLTLWLLCANGGLAAYVQTQRCSTKTHDVFDVLDYLTFRASVEPDNDDNERSRLVLTFSGPLVNATMCDHIEKMNLSSTMQMESLGRSPSYDGHFRSSKCVILDPPKRRYPMFEFVYDIAKPHALETYYATVDVREGDKSIDCLNAYLTPDIGEAFSQSVTWVPIGVLLIVISAALWWEAYNLAGEGVSEVEQTGSSLRQHRRNHVIRVADCLSYLQFIFFSGSLSLKYPGFFQPIVSHLSWSTLMLRLGIVARHPWYPGTHDGLYAINGTFGGTPGMELMTQVMGGTVTFDTWLNTIALSTVVLFVVAALVCLRHRLKRSRSVDATEDLLLVHHHEDHDTGLKNLFWATLRLFCSYLLLPLVAWSTYQFTYSGRIPISYVVAAGLTVCLLVIMVWWALRQKSPQQMGYLLVDNAEGNQNMARLSHTQGLYATSVFVLLFMRGAIIGGLQIVGLVQLPMLMAIEVVHLGLYAYAFSHNPFTARVGVVPTIRLFILCLMVAFLPGTAGFRTRSGLGYAILAAHGVVILLCFLVPAFQDVFCLVSTSASMNGFTKEQKGKRDTAYALRQIMGRPTKALPLGIESSPTDFDSPHLHQSPGFRDSESPLFLTEPSDGSSYSYFRSPRHSTRPKTAETQNWAQHSVTPGGHSSQSDSPTSDTTLKFAEETYQPADPSDASCLAVASDPNVDYSFRESDLYYVQPRTKVFGDEGPNSRQTESMKHRFRKLNAALGKLMSTSGDS